MAGDEKNIESETFKKLDWVTTGTYIWISLIIIFGIIFVVPKDGLSLNCDRIIFASTGVLTFIAIFYSLLISREGKRIMDEIQKILLILKTQLRKSAQEEIGKTKNISKTLSKIGTKNARINFVKKLTSMEYILFIAVISFLLSILLTLFNGSEFCKVSYAFFIVGLGCSSGLVFEWTLIYKIIQSYIISKSEDKDEVILA